MSNKKPSRDEPGEGAVANSVAQPGIDEILLGLVHKGSFVPRGKTINTAYIEEASKALYHRLAAEAVAMGEWNSIASRPTLAIPLSKLKAIMEIKE